MAGGATHFEVVLADAPGPVVVEVPHAGLVIDEASARFTSIPELVRRAGAVRADADLGADVIWERSEQVGVTRVVARTHRYVIDLNTNPRPPPMPPFYEENPAPKATIRRSAAGVSWREDALPRGELERRIREVFEPYHAAIDDQLEISKARHGYALLVASHTFPPQRGVDAQVVLGTREGATLDARVRDAVAEVFRDAGVSVGIEQPFPGGFALTRHARPADRIWALQIEIVRDVLVEPGEARELSNAGVARFKTIVADAVAAATRALANL